MDWSSEGTYKLIELLEQRPILWKKSLEDYKNVVKRSDALKEIAANFENCSEEDVKSKSINFSFQIRIIIFICCLFAEKIRSLRKVHSEKLRQIKTAQKKSGSAPKQVKWEYFKAMEFLLGETAEAGGVDSLIVKYFKLQNKFKIIILVLCFLNFRPNQ